MKHTDPKYWWEDLPQAREAYREVCSVGWRGIKGTGIDKLYDRPEPDGLLLTYYTLVFAIEAYVSSSFYLRKFAGIEEESQGSKGGPQ